MELPLTMIIAVNQVRRQFEECAPDAPAQPYFAPVPRTHRVRAASARVLVRLADAVAPPPQPACR